MMFNGLIMCGDSDFSDVTKDSGGPSSLVDSCPSVSDPNARADRYYNKLMSTLRILKNKEETIRVQAESLELAEERISAFIKREKKMKEPKTLHEITAQSYTPMKVDVSTTVDEELERQSDMVNTLENNLSVIEDLYRECFYETAKQEDLIEMLRKSYLDVRLMDKQKADQIGRLQTVINTQKWSLDRCQDIALEVDNLKTEIHNFLSGTPSVNNDSGMWESVACAGGAGVHDDLHDITEQLLRLRGMLNVECFCGSKNENDKLKKDLEEQQRMYDELRRRSSELEERLSFRENEDNVYKREIELRDDELQILKEQLEKLTANVREQNVKFEQLSSQMLQAESLLNDKDEELVHMRSQCDAQRDTISGLRQMVEKADLMCQENCKIRSEVSFLTTQVAQWRAQLADSERRVQHLDNKLRETEAGFREKENNVQELQTQLEEAHARSSVLCADARRALCAIRHWGRRMRERHREQQNAIKERDALIATLRGRAGQRQSHNVSTNTTLEDPYDYGSSRRDQTCTIASCSTTPTPPRRLFRRKACDNMHYVPSPRSCEASVQQQLRQDACVEPRDARYMRIEPNADIRRSVSPSDELFLRVEQLSEALAEGYRRWSRPEPR